MIPGLMGTGHPKITPGLTQGCFVLLLTPKAMETQQRDGSCPATAAGFAPAALGQEEEEKEEEEEVSPA